MKDSDSSNAPVSVERRRVLMGLGAAGAAIAGASLTGNALAATAPAQVTEAPKSEKTQDHNAFHGYRMCPRRGPVRGEENGLPARPSRRRSWEW